MTQKWFIITVILFQICNAEAKEVLARARIYAGNLSSSLEDVNTELKAQGLSKYDGVLRAGFEAAIPFWKLFSVGMGYVERYVRTGDSSSMLNPQNFAELRQRSVLFVARLPVINTKNVIVEAFSGVGLANTTLQIKTASLDGELSRVLPDSQFATAYTTYGGAVAVGANGFYLVVEAGHESNSVERLNKTGTTNNNIDVIDLSGAYYTVGFLFDGTKLTSK